MSSHNYHFDWLAPLYDRVIPAPDPERLPALLRLPTDGWLLEVGGGTGRAVAPLQPLVGRLVICDLSAPMLAQAQAKGIACPVQAEAERLPFPDGHFDRVLVVDALHHFSNQQQAIGELVRVLKPGGRLVIEEPDITRRPVKFVALFERLALMGSHFYPPAAIQEMIAARGLATQVETDGHFTAWIVADN